MISPIQSSSTAGSLNTAGYTASTSSPSSSSSLQSPLTPTQNCPLVIVSRPRGLGDGPVSTNSLASNPSSPSASSTYVHLSGSTYEDLEENYDDDVDKLYDDSYNDLIDNDIYDDDLAGDAVAPFSYYDIPAFEETLPFHVLALYDFTEEDQEGILPFQKGDLFEIINVQPSGWWGAQPIDDSAVGATINNSPSKRQEQSEFEQGQAKIGWISSAFVNVVPTYLVQRLKDTPREQRISTYNRAEPFVDPLGGVDSLIQYLYC